MLYLDKFLRVLARNNISPRAAIVNTIQYCNNIPQSYLIYQSKHYCGYRSFRYRDCWLSELSTDSSYTIISWQRSHLCVMASEIEIEQQLAPLRLHVKEQV